MTRIVVRSNDAAMAQKIAHSLVDLGWSVSIQFLTSPSQQPVVIDIEQNTTSSKQKLTPREQEILTLVAGGLTNEQIAARAYIGVRTVRQHVSNLLRKLDLRNRAQLVTYFHSLKNSLGCPYNQDFRRCLNANWYADPEATAPPKHSFRDGARRGHTSG